MASSPQGTPRAPSSPSAAGSTPMSMAGQQELVQRNDAAAVAALLDSGSATVTAQDSGGWHLIHVAARANAVDAAQTLLVRAPPRCAHVWGGAPPRCSRLLCTLWDRARLTPSPRALFAATGARSGPQREI
jgi:hypothetical protein